MKKFLVKNILFLFPIVFLHIFTLIFYSTNKGDLLRLGYLVDISSNYRDAFNEEFKNNINFSKISETKKQNNYNILIIGDSFSGQKNFGYKNYLGNKPDINVLYFDRELHSNPLQTLYSLLNGDFFDEKNIKYIILQSVERAFVKRIKNLDTTKILNYEALNKLVEEKKTIKKENYSNKFLSDRVFKFPFYNLLYLFDDNAYFSSVYRTELNDNLFSVNNNELLFYYQDINALKTNNSMEEVSSLNDILNDLSNKLKDKGIKLIVLPSPDKYGLYYDYIVEKTKYPKPLLFEHLDKIEKKYLYVNSKKILTDAVRRKKDIYFYDDTHWSPWASKLISDEIYKLINSDD